MLMAVVALTQNVTRSQVGDVIVVPTTVAITVNAVLMENVDPVSKPLHFRGWRLLKVNEAVFHTLYVKNKVVREHEC